MPRQCLCPDDAYAQSMLYWATNYGPLDEGVILDSRNCNVVGQAVNAEILNAATLKADTMRIKASQLSWHEVTQVK